MSFALMMTAEACSEMLVVTRDTTQRHIPDDVNLLHGLQNLPEKTEEDYETPQLIQPANNGPHA